MTREEFIQILDEKGISYEIIGDKIVVTEDEVYPGYNIDLSSLESIPPGVVFNNVGWVSLRALETIPPGVEFKNGGGVDLHSLETLPPGVEFKNGGGRFAFNNGVYLHSLTGDWFEDWNGNIEGIASNTLLNGMIKRGIFL